MQTWLANQNNGLPLDEGQPMARCDRREKRKLHMTKAKLTLVAAITTSILSSSAFAASRDSETVLQPNSPVATGGGSLGYNITQQNSDGN
jgi:hypothetical protein